MLLPENFVLWNRCFLLWNLVYKFMIALLDAKHQDVCFSACGVLLNLTVDKSKRGILNEDGGIKKWVQQTSHCKGHRKLPDFTGLPYGNINLAFCILCLLKFLKNCLDMLGFWESKRHATTDSWLFSGSTPNRLIDCLRDFGPIDWQLACLICKTLWNYSENVTSAAPCFEEVDSSTLLLLLASLLGKQEKQPPCSPLGLE